MICRGGAGLLFGALLMFSVGCTDTSTNTSGGGGCVDSSDCPTGYVCLANGACQGQGSCVTDAQCCPNPLEECLSICQNNLCVDVDCAPGETQPCYDGCHSGYKECTGGTWAPCNAPPVFSNDASCDGLDDDCDGVTDEDCDPCAGGGAGLPEVCGDGIDNDCDGFLDDEDPDCNPCLGDALPPEGTPDVCGDDIDNDCDGLTDEGCSPCEEPGAVQACTGICSEGSQECGEDLFWGPCIDSVECSCLPGESTTTSCGNCGTAIAICTEQGQWKTEPQCEEEKACAPGQVETQTCGKCGQRNRICGNDCEWGEWGSCQDEVGECIPGATDTASCGSCGLGTTTCDNACTWGPVENCVGSGICTPGEEDVQECGKCGTRVSSCTDLCEWGVPGPCLGQGECAAGATETQSCGTGKVETRECGDSCSWGAWGACVAEVSCGAGKFPCPGGSGCCEYSAGGCTQAANPHCPGCICGNCVCGLDSYCCNTAWDNVCVAECQADCGGCGQFNDGCKSSASLGVSQSMKTCDGSIHPLTGNCYKSFSSTAEWPDAKTACENWGGYLVTIHFQDEMTFVDNLASCGQFWIGLSDLKSENTFQWTDGALLANSAAYANWDPGEPNNKGNSEDCVHVYSNGKWNDEDCDADKCFVCEKNLQSSAGCSGCLCESCVCSQMPSCCSSNWTAECAALCDSGCGECGYRGCSVESSAGCDGCPCENCVCAADSYCCSTQWDQLCADRCVSDCGGCAPLPLE